MIVTATEFKTNLGKYLEMAASMRLLLPRTEKTLLVSQSQLAINWHFWMTL